MFRQAAVIVIGSIGWAVPALANINLEFRPPSQNVVTGNTANIGLYAVSDDETDQLLMSAQVIIAWDPSFLQLLGIDHTGAVPLESSEFPANDPFNLNEVVPPQDGDGLYVALAPLGDPVAATPEGTLLTTFQFLTLAETPQTAVDILECAGDPEGHTIVYDGTVPNLDVTGTLTGAIVVIVSGPVPVALDIKPPSCPNPFNPASRGSIPIALVGSPEFDVTTVDLTSLWLSRADGVGGSVAPRVSAFRDVATPFLGEPCDCHELRGDGITDLKMKFDARSVVDVLELREIGPRAPVLLTLTGRLLDGYEFIGMDCLWRTKGTSHRR